MRILFVQQYLGRFEEPVYPMGIHVLYNHLLDKDCSIEMDFIDMNKSTSPTADLRAKLIEYKPYFIGISLRNIDTADSRDCFYYLSYLTTTLDTIKKISNIPIVIGGTAFSLYAAEIMTRYNLLDFGIFLEGEEAFFELVKNIDKHESIRGIFYRKDDLVKFSGGRDFIDLATSKPRTKYIAPPKEYKSTPFFIESKRGCMFNCAYCRYVLLGNSHLRLRSIEDVLDEIEDLANNHGVSSLLFVDPIFNIPIDHAGKICEGIIRRNLKTKWTAKFDEKNIDSDFVKLAIKAGCEEFFFSPVGFNDTTLKSLNKNISQKDIKRVCKIARKTKGMNISLDFVRSPPDDSLRGFLRLVFFISMVKLMLRKKARNIFLKNLRIELDTELQYRAIQDKVISPDQNLFPKTGSDLKDLYYRNPRTRYIDTVLSLFFLIKKEFKKSKKCPNINMPI